MKELLYIPSGKFFRFYDLTDSTTPSLSIEAFSKTEEAKDLPEHNISALTRIVIRNNYFREDLYEYAKIPKGKLTKAEFQIVTV